MSEAAPPLLSPPAQTEALLFIDLDGSTESVDQLLRAVRDVPAGFLTQASHVIARVPSDGPSGSTRAAFRESLALSLQQNLRRRGVSPETIAITDFPVGAEPIITTITPAVLTPATKSTLLTRARKVELAMLLSAGRAIWEPTAYHYQVPSGLHSARYIRTADAIQRPRDATVLASWLHRHIRDRIGLVLDSSTTVAIALSLDAAARLAGFRLGPVVSLQDYPHSQFEVLAASSRAAVSGSALALLSVSSSGGTRDRLLSALSERGRGAVEVLVDRQGSAAERLDDFGRGWIGLTEDARAAEECALCMDSERSALVPIDPRTFAPHSVPDPTLMVPDIGDASENRRLFELYDSTDSVGLECVPHPATQHQRPSGNLAFRFYPHNLPNPEYGVAKDFHLALRTRFRGRSVQDQFKSQPQSLGALIVPALDRSSPGFDGVLEVIRAEMPFISDYKTIQVGAEPAEQLRTELQDVSEVLVVTVGSMSGVTLSDVNVQIHDHSEARVWGLAIHARPSTSREWITLKNSYSGNLAAAWLTLLPERSLFREEAQALRFARSLVEPVERQADFVDCRIARSQVGTAEWSERVKHYELALGLEHEPRIPVSKLLFDPYAIFWGMPQQGRPPATVSLADANASPWQKEVRIRKGSYYGERLRAITTLAAVGPAMQFSRETAMREAAPVRRQFDMTAISRSYFDPLLLASIIRWCRPDEAWWGREDMVSAVLQETLARFDHDHDGQNTLLAEMLLGAIMGKIPGSGLRTLADAGRHFSESLPEGDVRSALEWGSVVVSRAAARHV